MLPVADQRSLPAHFGVRRLLQWRRLALDVPLSAKPRCFREGYIVEELLEALTTYMDCQTWEEAEQIVREHPELLSPQPTSMLACFAADLPVHTVKLVLRPHSDLLTRC